MWYSVCTVRMDMYNIYSKQAKEPNSTHLINLVNSGSISCPYIHRSNALKNSWEHIKTSTKSNQCWVDIWVHSLGGLKWNFRPRFSVFVVSTELLGFLHPPGVGDVCPVSITVGQYTNTLKASLGEFLLAPGIMAFTLDFIILSVGTILTMFSGLSTALSGQNGCADVRDAYQQKGFSTNEVPDFAVSGKKVTWKTTTVFKWNRILFGPCG